MYKAIIFDFGNTIAKSGSLARSLKAVISDERASAVGVRIEREIFALYKPDQEIQPDWRKVWERCFSESGLIFNEDIGRMHLEAFCQSNELFPDVKKLFVVLKRYGFKLGLLSNATGPQEFFQKDFETRGLARYFDGIVWSSAIGYRKPSPKAFKAILGELGVSPEEALMIGDSEIADIEGASRVGMDAALVSSIRNVKTSAKYRVAPDSLLDDVIAIAKIRGGHEYM